MFGGGKALAQEAKEMASKALSELSAHTAVCTERHSTIEKRLTGIDNTLRWMNRQGLAVLLSIIGAILLGIAGHKGLF